MLAFFSVIYSLLVFQKIWWHVGWCWAPFNTWKTTATDVMEEERVTMWWGDEDTVQALHFNSHPGQLSPPSCMWRSPISAFEDLRVLRARTVFQHLGEFSSLLENQSPAHEFQFSFMWPAKGFVSQVHTQPCASPSRCRGSCFVVLVFHIYIYMSVYLFIFCHSNAALLDVNSQRVKSERGAKMEAYLRDGGGAHSSKCRFLGSNKCFRWWISESCDSS